MAEPVKALQICPYKIQSPLPLNAKENEGRVGWLLRCKFSPNLIGYADFHPLPVLKSPESLLREALSGNPGPQFNQSLAFAYIDAKARAQQKSLFEGLVAPLS